MIAVVMGVLQFFSVVFVVVIGFGLLVLIYMYVTDVTQTTHAIRRNYPVIGRFRYFFEHVGEFFRQYFFAMDREELPFNRAERSWVYRAAKNLPNTVAFGSTRNLRPTGTMIFVNCPFPKLEKDEAEIQEVTIGPYCREPYKTRSLVNVSAMSFGALSEPAVRALAMGTAKAGAWMNTGEGGLAPVHLSSDGDIVFQMGTAKFGVRTLEGTLDDEKLRQVAAHSQVKMIEIKLSQGAKPGKGGILPAAKVTKEIAEIRGIEEGKAAISPNRHPEVDNVSQLVDMIEHVREVSGLHRV